MGKPCVCFAFSVKRAVLVVRYLKFLDTNNLWMGRGGSKSVVRTLEADVPAARRVASSEACVSVLQQVHYDDQDFRWA